MRRVPTGLVTLWTVSLFLATSIPCAVFSQISSGLGANNSEARYTLTGTVVNSLTGEPIRRALVQIYAGNERLAFTDGSGQFEFDNLPASQVSVSVRKPGFFAEQEVDRGLPPPIAIVSPDSKPLTLKLVPQSVIFGRIQSSSGAPIEGILVKLMMSRIVEGRKRWEQSGGAATDEDGDFRIAHLLPGSYYLEVGPSQSLQEPNANDRGYPALFYPGVTEISSATRFELGPGQQLDADMSLVPVRFFKVSGTLAGYVPDGGINIEFIDRLGNRFSFLKKFNQETGQFEAVVPAGFYTAQVTEWIPNSSPARAEVPLNVGSDVSGVGVVLGPMLPVPVAVRTEGTTPANVPHAQRQNGPLVTVHLIRDGDTVGSSDGWSNWQGSPNPSLVIPNAAPGRYSVEVTPNGSWYVQSVQCGNVNLLSDELTIGAGVQPATMEIVLGSDGATLTGRVTASQKLVSARVVLVPEHGSPAQIKSVGINPEGNFFLNSLAPGSYSVLAFDRADALEYTNPEVLDRYLSRAAHVALEPNGQQQITLDLINVSN